ncbi:MAG TPA: arylesterase [Patescibacteria group bacterium]|nr:arylesterase [Patescibacteria group bacterium]
MKNILFFGDSLTAGYGVGSENSFPSIISNKIKEIGWDFKTSNAGISGDTTTGGANRIEHVLKSYKRVDVFVLELGANDGLRGVNPSRTKQNLQAIIDKVKKTFPEAKILLCAMLVPPFYGPVHADRFNALYPELIQENPGTVLVPFFLENVVGVEGMCLADGLHPSAAGYKVVAENVWKVLKPALEKI